MTAGYQTESFNIHGSLSGVRPSFDEEDLLMASVGLSIKVSPRLLLIGRQPSEQSFAQRLKFQGVFY